MAIKYDYQEYLPESLSDFQYRELIWLWYYLEGRGWQLDIACLSNPEALSIFISRALGEAEEKLFSEIREAKSMSIIDSKEITVLNGSDRRVISWLLYQVHKLYNFSFRSEWFHNYLSDESVFLAALDCDSRSVVAKKEILAQLRANWSSVLEFDQYLNWIDDKDEEQSYWLLSQASSANLPHEVLGEVNAPINSKERVIKFRCILDQSNLSIDLKKDFVDRLKRQWSAKGRLKSKDRVQSNLLVLPETKDGIKKLKGRFQLKTGGEVLDKLVKEALNRE
ncbi:hypothetical protein [Marinobacter sp. C2H3]|uniref:hypothetical protein n=1 Tax=Marinobacter sp. C2H3 TaxID=3119003 RepID=UPI00300ED0EC